MGIELYLGIGWLIGDAMITVRDYYQINTAFATIGRYVNENNKIVAYERERDNIPKWGIGPFSLASRLWKRHHIKRRLEEIL